MNLQSIFGSNELDPENEWKNHLELLRFGSRENTRLKGQKCIFVVNGRKEHGYQNEIENLYLQLVECPSSLEAVHGTWSCACVQGNTDEGVDHTLLEEQPKRQTETLHVCKLFGKELFNKNWG